MNMSTQKLFQEIDLPAPKVLEADTFHVLYPIPVQGERPYTFTLRVEYPGMTSEQWIEPQLVIKGVSASTPIPGKQGDSVNGFVDFILTESIVSLMINSEAWISYIVSEGAVSVPSQQMLELTVQRMLDTDLPFPEILDAEGTVLDLKKVSGPVKCKIPPMAYLRAGHVFWMRVEGQDEDLNPIYYYVAESRVVTQVEEEEGITLFIDRDWLSLCRDFSAITLIPEVNYQGNKDHNQAAELRRQTWQLLQLSYHDEINEDFETLPVGFIQAGQSIATDLITCNFLSGAGRLGGMTFGGLPGMREGKCLVLCYLESPVTPEQHVRIELKQAVVRLKFSFTSLYRGSTIVFFNSAGDVEDTVVLPHGKPPEEAYGNHFWVDVTAKITGQISAFEFTVSDYSFIDNLDMWIK